MSQIQPDLFGHQPEQHQQHIYWREMLSIWLEDIWSYRHDKYTTGWSMATQGFCYARWLYRDAAMPRAEFRRWWRLNRRVMLWERKRWTDREQRVLEATAA